MIQSYSKNDKKLCWKDIDLQTGFISVKPRLEKVQKFKKPKKCKYLKSLIT